MSIRYLCYLLLDICLQNRPGSPNVVCPSASSNVETKNRMTRMTESQDERMTGWMTG